MELSTAQLAQLAALMNGAKPPKAKKAKGTKREKLTDDQKALNAKANAEAAVKLFEDAGFKDCRAHETIKTYDKWVEGGRRVKKGEKATRTARGVALFHLDQTSEIVKSN